MPEIAKPVANRISVQTTGSTQMAWISTVTEASAVSAPKVRTCPTRWIAAGPYREPSRKPTK